MVALAKRWHSKMSSFHLSTSEAIMTLAQTFGGSYDFLFMESE